MEAFRYGFDLFPIVQQLASSLPPPPKPRRRRYRHRGGSKRKQVPRTVYAIIPKK